MKYSFAAAALVATVAADKRDLCADGSQDIGGNWYCQAVEAITYTGMSGAGSYNKVTNMGADGSCSTAPHAYSGSMCPLDEELSMHFRGPIQLKSVAVYAPQSGSKARRSAHASKHAHHHAHGHNHKERAVGDMVTATIDGQVVSWVNQYAGPATPAAAPVAAAAAPPAGSASSASSSASSKAVYVPSYTGPGWARTAYYNSSSHTAQGLVFLNNMGGAGSGVWDTTWGNSLSYASSDGTQCASQAEVLNDCEVPSGNEFSIFSDKPCSDGSCGYSRPGTVAHHGFGGANKAFFFEFEMPHDYAATGQNADMPAVWLLNAQIPRTAQYASCSCWSSGCGELDLFEVLSPGDDRCKSTLHSNIAGGDSDYFQRPVNQTMKAAVVFNGENIHIKKLDDSYTFGTHMDTATINSISQSTSTQNQLTSLFSLIGAAGDSHA
ncbi:Hypothetical protein R9X50_00536300 [Acrodontium crateriforme]|uniref:glucan endo-1,3-beta-D-glucosidase n=1 Tax=Acrodontium crateriforme TaxID=150365 RepID=A0AAQ3M966_9PEZI|nr:Hypothetical protein R9X50_00536300 [Acrodontium crateriforme]